MDNSYFAVESAKLQVNEPVNSDSLQEREAKLTKIIEAIREVRKTRGWSSLKTEIFDEMTAILERQISAEAKKMNPDIQKLNRLSGELKWAERYSDLEKYEVELKVELTNVRKQLN